MPVIVSPGSHAQTYPTLGHAYVFAAEAIRQKIVERLNVLQAGLAFGVGQLAGSGSDTVRLPYFGGVGFAEELQAMTGESDAIVPSGWDTGYDEVTLGRYGLAKEQTYQDQILQTAEAIGLSDLEAMVPDSYLATVRSSLATVASTFASGAGAAAAAWTMDDELELVSLFHETEGFTASMRPVTMRHPEQFTDLRLSIRNEPAFQGDSALMQALLGLATDDQGAFNFLGFRNFSSHAVPTSGGGHVGGAYIPGAIGLVTANTLPIEVENPAKTVFIPDLGIVIERKSTGEIATARFAANAWFGLAKASADVFPQFKITSIND